MRWQVQLSEELCDLTRSPPPMMIGRPRPKGSIRQSIRLCTSLGDGKCRPNNGSLQPFGNRPPPLGNKWRLPTSPHHALRLPLPRQLLCPIVTSRASPQVLTQAWVSPWTSLSTMLDVTGHVTSVVKLVTLSGTVQVVDKSSAQLLPPWTQMIAWPLPRN